MALERRAKKAEVKAEADAAAALQVTGVRTQARAHPIQCVLALRHIKSGAIDWSPTGQQLLEDTKVALTTCPSSASACLQRMWLHRQSWHETCGMRMSIVNACPGASAFLEMQVASQVIMTLGNGFIPAQQAGAQGNFNPGASPFAPMH
eukprot:scaffold309920_cov22-Tisochrysis_lutea.AAC.1